MIPYYKEGREGEGGSEEKKKRKREEEWECYNVSFFLIPEDI